LHDLRHAFAMLVVVTFLPLFSAWLLVHPLIRVWRRLGPVVTYTVLAAYSVAGMSLLWLMRGPLLRVEFGWSPWLGAAGAACLALSVYLRFRLWRQLTLSIMLGVPELVPPAGSRPLTEGIYSRIRHPRYVEGGLVVMGMALLTNYLAAYALVAAYVIIIRIVVTLEERELVERFGAEYAEYASRVPRFVPKLGRGRGKPPRKGNR
jgi:protein-S-isoprenylcysteine O-methyltransferase Ste14